MPAAAAVSGLDMTDGTGSDVVWRGDTIYISGSTSNSDDYVTFRFTDSNGDTITITKQNGEGDFSGSPEGFTFRIDLVNYDWSGGDDSKLTTGKVTVEADQGQTFTAPGDDQTRFQAEDSPDMVGAETVDSDGDGNVDRIRVEFNENVYDSSLDVSDFTVSGTTVEAISDGGTDRWAVLDVSDISGTDATPTVTLAAESVSDQSTFNTGPTSEASVTAVDGASPVVTQATWEDTDANGDIDTATLAFSEPVDITDSNGAGDGLPAFTISGPDGTAAIDAKDYGATGATTLRLEFTGSQVDTTGTPNLKIGYDAANTASYVVESGGTNGDGTGTDGTDDELDSGSDIARSNVDSASPVIETVVTQDTDPNGKVDRLAVTLSEKIDHTTVETGDFSISDNGGLAGTLGSVTTAPKETNSNTLYVAITESTGPDSYDTDATPTLAYSTTADSSDTDDVADSAGNLLASTTKTATDDAAPAVVAASTADTDANGDVDTIDVTLSEPLDDSKSTFSQSTFSVSSGSVDGVSTGTGGSDALVTVSVAGLTGTSVTPDVTLEADQLHDTHDNAITSAQTFTGTVDDAAPVIETVLTRDTDTNGRIDQLEVTLSETVDYTSVEADDFSLSSSVYTGDGIQGVTTDPETTNSDTLHVTLAESQDTHDTSATPDLTYSSADSDSTDVADLAADPNPLADTTTTATDGASPVVTEAAWRDTDKNGDIDTVALTFSETVDAIDSGSNDRFPALTIRDASGTAHQIDVGSYTDSSQTTLSFPFSGDQIDTTDATGLTVDYATGTTAHVVEKGGLAESDAGSTNDEVDAGSGVALSTVDSADPIIETVATRDTDKNGKVDQLGVTFSESIDSASVETGDFSISNAGGLAGTLDSVTTATGSADTLHAAITESTGADPYDTDATPTLEYSTTADSDSTDVADLAGNLLASTTKTATDGAAPAIVGARTGDSDANGDVDTIDVTLSEPLSDTDSTFGTETFSISNPSGTVTGASTGTGGDDAATMTVSGLSGTGVTPDVTLAAGTLSDGSNALASAQTFTGTADGAAPVMETVATRDSNRNGRIDQLDVTLSEPVDDATIQPGDFSIASPNGYSGTGIPQGGVGTGTQGGDETLVVSLDEGSTPDTDATPELAYTSADSDSTDLADLAGNLLADTTMTATDGAAPAIVGAQTGDSNADGNTDTIDVTLSEPLSDTGSTFDTSTFSISSPGGSVTGASTGATENDDAATMTVSGIAGTSATPDVTLATGALADAGGNTLDSAGTFTGTVDGAAPVVWTISTIDADADGNVDGATVVASEHVDDGTLSPSGWSMGGKSVEAVDTGSTAHDETFRVRFTSDEKEFEGTAVTPDVIYSGGSVADPAGNLLRDLGSDDVSETDGVAPTVTSVSATNPGGQTIEFSVTSAERLDAVEAAVSGPESATLTEFTESGSGPYTYTATYEADSGGTYTVTLARATDAAGNDGASGQSDSVDVPESLEEETTTTTTSSGGGGSGGFSTTTTTTTTTTSTSTPTPTETETETPTPSEPTVDVVRSASGDEATVDVSDPYTGDPVRIPGDDSGPLVSSRNVTVDSLDVTVGDGLDYTMNLSLTDTAPGSTPPLGTQTGQTSLGYLDVDHTATNVTGATIRFRVNRSVLEELGVNDSEVTLYQEDNGTWAPVEAAYVGGNGTHAAYTADTSGLDTFAFGVPTSQFVVRSITLESATIQTGETATIKATIANTGEKDATHAARLYAGGEYVRTVSVTIPAGERRTVTFEPAFEEAGSYPLAVNSYIGPTLTVESTTTTSDGTNQSNLSSLVAVLPAWLWLVLFFVIVGLVAAAIERWSHN